jgi:hypothetical protein
VAFPAKRNQVVNGVNLFGATHAPGFDVVNVHRLRMAHLTRDKIGYIVTHAFQICFCVRFDAQSLFVNILFGENVDNFNKNILHKLLQI